MSEPARDPLDQQIDRVAARLVSVDHDEAILERIVAGLPERNERSGWLAVLAPQAALAAVLIVAALVWTTTDREPVAGDPVRPPMVANAGPTAIEAPVVSAPRAEVSAPVNAARVAARRVTESVPVALADHERSLAPVEAPAPIDIAALASPSLPEEASVVLAPLVLTELPLSGESNSPRK